MQGHAIGAGFQLALACDLRVLADDAQLAMAEVTLGLVPDLGGTKRLVELVGYSRALEICVTGRRMGAAEADRLGLATVVVPRPSWTRPPPTWPPRCWPPPRDAVVEIKALLAGARRPVPDRAGGGRAGGQVRRMRDLAAAAPAAPV